jgi:hypothetical protein
MVRHIGKLNIQRFQWQLRRTEELKISKNIFPKVAQKFFSLSSKCLKLQKEKSPLVSNMLAQNKSSLKVI